jgi:hypothetical protein
LPATAAFALVGEGASLGASAFEGEPVNAELAELPGDEGNSTLPFDPAGTCFRWRRYRYR